jgi:RHS repeat-associated protein
MKKSSVFILFCLFAGLLSAQQPTALSSAMTLSSGDLANIIPAPPARLSARPERDTVMLNQLSTTGGAIRMPADLRVPECALVLSFYQNTQLPAAAARDFNASVSVKIQYRSRTELSRLDTLRLRLRINNATTPGATPQAKDVFVLSDVVWADILVDSFDCSTPLTTEASAGSDLFFLKAEILGDQYLVAQPTMMPGGIQAGIADNGGYVNLRWTPLPWAESYDLEWTFVDQYTTPDAAGAIPFSFRNNATRVNMRATNYEIPLVFEPGKLVFRVRANGRRSDGTPVAGVWSKPESGFVNASGTTLYASGVLNIPTNMVHEQGRKNWQYIGSFGENGLRRDVVSYFDGAMYQRQNVSRLNTNGQYLIVGETFYDHQGRPAVTALPAPFKPNPGSERLMPDFTLVTLTSIGTDFWKIPAGLKQNQAQTTLSESKKIKQKKAGKVDPFLNPALSNSLTNAGDHPSLPWVLNFPRLNVDDLNAFLPTERPTLDPALWTETYRYATTNPALRYQPRFNVNAAGAPYGPADFDLRDTSSGVCNIVPPAKPFGTMSGAGQYYSPNNPSNPLTDKYRDLIPDAEGFPFTQIEFTPDMTGRVKRQGSVGATMQLGQGHDQQLFYSVPTQFELDRLFGNDAGDAHLYKKVAARDQNGQISIAYQNGQGQTVASGLAGAAPANLLPLERENALQQTELVAENTRWENDHAVKIAAKPILISQDNTDFRLRYDLDPEQFRTATCDGAVLCDNCVYDLDIRVKNDCGQTLWNVRRRIGTLDNLQNCASTAFFGRDTLLRLNAGAYTVEKYLRVNVENRERFVTAYLAQIRPCVKREIEPQIKAIPCIPDQCTPCAFEFGTYRGISAWQRRTGNQADCQRGCGDEGMFDYMTYEALLRDLRPGGQYGQIMSTTPDGTRTADAAGFPLSVFNTANQLNTLNTLSGVSAAFLRNYTNPVFSYRNADGSLAEIDVTEMPATAYISGAVVNRGGRLFVSPQNILDIAFLNEIWQDSWSESLLPYHPEYPYLLWNTANKNAIRFDTLLLRARTWTMALASGYIVPTGGAVSEDFLRKDPFFNNADRINWMRSALNNIDIGGGTTVNVYQLLRLSIRCNSPYYQDVTRRVELATCYGSGSLTDLDAAEQQMAWEMFRSIYLSKKAQIMDQERGRAMRSGGLMENNCIDANTFSCPDCSDARLRNLLQDKQRRFQRMDCFAGRRDLPIRRVDADGDGSPASTIDTRWGKGYIAAACGVDSVAQGWLNFFTAMTLEGKLTGTSSIPGRPPMVLSAYMIAEFPNRSVPNYRWTGTVSGRNLTVRITDPSGTEQALMVLSLETSGINWQDLAVFTCIQCSGTSDFYLTAYTKNEHREARIRMLSERGFNIRNSCIQGQPFNEQDQRTNKQPYSCCIPVFPPLQPGPSCDTYARGIEKVNEQRAIDERLAYLTDSVRVAYTLHCMAASEHFTLNWSEPTYQFTLFYYDQAGNLIKTVPPQGVAAINDTLTLRRVQNHRVAPDRNATVFPEHNDNDDDNAAALATNYRYNAFNQKIYQNTPDGGVTRWLYDEIGRPVLTQDAEQSAHHVFGYLQYDAQGREVESGVTAANPAFEVRIPGSGMVAYGPYKTRLSVADKSELYRTQYDTPLSADVQAKFTGGGQQHLRNRPAAMAYYADGTGTPDYAAHFSYDMAGNVSEFLQDFRALGAQINLADAAAHSQKLVRYQYDLISGAVKEVVYQPGSPDQFYHWYQYDADNRLIAVQTGTQRYESADTRTREARYDYYLHGPLARAELGQADIQGVDFAYTIQGKLKNLNSISPNSDPGADGFFNLFATDATALSLGYFNGDYKPIGGSGTAAISSNLAAAAPGLYNGNLRYSIGRNNGLADQPLTATAYRFDQLSRLRSSTVLLPGTAAPLASDARPGGLFDPASDLGWAVTDRWRTTLEYDRNGNIIRLNRRGQSGGALDNLTYKYTSNSNRLRHISDTDGQISATGAVIDLPNQGDDNYQYDAKGRLISDRAEGNAELSWSATDKLLRYRRGGNDTRFFYDAFGRRALKKSDERNGVLTVRDLRGNVMANYTIRNGHAFLQDMPIYASTRIGVWQLGDSLVMSPIRPAGRVVHYSGRSGQKGYELTNQTGDVLAVVSDRKLPVSIGGSVLWAPDYVQAQDYYPFGMPMPGRVKETTQAYAFGFQGMERDNDLKGRGNAYSTEFRQYDPRVGRWLSLDPMEAKYAQLSPYVAFLNNSVQTTDPFGDDPPSSDLNGKDLTMAIINANPLVPDEGGSDPLGYDPSFGAIEVPAPTVSPRPQYRIRGGLPRRLQPTVDVPAPPVEGTNTEEEVEPGRRSVPPIVRPVPPRPSDYTCMEPMPDLGPITTDDLIPRSTIGQGRVPGNGIHFTREEAREIERNTPLSASEIWALHREANGVIGAPFLIPARPTRGDRARVRQYISASEAILNLGEAGREAHRMGEEIQNLIRDSF